MFQDLRYAIRTLRQTPGFTVVAVLTLALGIGASAAVATQIDAVFFQSIPVGDPESLRTLSWSSPRRAFTLGLFRGPLWSSRPITTFPVEAVRHIADRAASFAAVACWRSATQALTEQRVLRVDAVSGSFFETVRVNAIMGRTLSEDDDRPGAPLVAVVREPELFNQIIAIHGHAFTVVGILPPDFKGLNPTAAADVYVPYAADRLFPTFQRNAWTECHLVARVKEGVSWEQARAETEVLLAQWIGSKPPTEAYDPPRVQAEELAAGFGDLRRRVMRPLQLLAATVGILLLISCANIGGLLFARGRVRQKEVATRLALGAPRKRIVRQLLTESLVLAMAGAAGGVAVAYALNPLLPPLLSELSGSDALAVTLRPDLRVLALSIVIAVMCGVGFGLLPALGAARLDPIAGLRQAAGISAPARVNAGKAALLVQLALATVVVVGAGLLVRTMLNLRAVPLGYRPEGLVFVETNNPVGRPRAVVEQTLADLRQLPGVASATVSQWPIFNNTVARAAFCIPWAAPAQQELDLSFVFPGFFETWGVRMLRGRDLRDDGTPGMVVNEEFIKRFLGGRDPLGITIATGVCPGRTPVPIVGVVANHIDRQRAELVPAVYLRYPQAGALYVTTYAVRTQGDARALVPAVRRTIGARGIAPTRDVLTGTQYRDSVMRQERLLTVLLVAFAAIALFIACLGVYGVLAYTVSCRTREIGLRMAIGALRLDVVSLIARESSVPVGAGLLVGLGAATWSGRVLESLLFGVSARDPVTAAAAAAVLLAASALAAWFPTRRATRVEPVVALRE